MRRLGVGLVLALLLSSGCAPAHSAESTHNPVDIHDDAGGNFLPAYLDYLQGKQPFPQDRCHPQNLHDLLIPCDEKDQP